METVLEDTIYSKKHTDNFTYKRTLRKFKALVQYKLLGNILGILFFDFYKRQIFCSDHSSYIMMLFLSERAAIIGSSNPKFHQATINLAAFLLILQMCMGF